MTHHLPIRLSRRSFISAAAVWGFVRILGDVSLSRAQAAGLPPAADVLRRGADFLLRAQAADGGWKSAVYGQLKGGAALTTLVLDGLSRLPERSAEHQAAIDRGFAFLSAGWAKRKTIAAPDGSLDFPTYGAALWLQTRRRLNVPIAALDLQAADFLLAAQCGPARGFEAAHPAAGGWDFLSAEDARGITTGTNLSVTRHVLEALEPTKTEAADAARKAALDWLARCQQRDGGFAFTPEPGSLNNKAEYSDEALLQPRSYGPPTCDGVRALLACGVKASDTGVFDASAVLRLGAPEHVAAIREHHVLRARLGATGGRGAGPAPDRQRHAGRRGGRGVEAVADIAGQSGLRADDAGRLGGALSGLGQYLVGRVARACAQ